MNDWIPYDERELVSRLKRRDHAALIELYNKYAPALYTLVLQIVRDADAGNAVMHKVFLTIWNSIDHYTPGNEKLFIWMLQVARSVALEELNSQPLLARRGKAESSESDQVELKNILPVDNAGLKKAIVQMEAEQKRLFELYYYDGLSVEQIAEMFSVPAGVIKSKIKLVLAELGTLLCKI